jgi:serine/threonine protein kinase/tetratricopeptide (TPR) repeat protein
MTDRPTKHLAAEDTPSPPGQLLTGLAVPRGAAPEVAILGPINGRYDLAERIAKGGMGIVYRAHDRLLNRTVAVKVMRGRYLDRTDLLRRFLAEARINGRLQHPGIVPVYEVGTIPDGRPFIAMKLIEGRTLARLLRERPTPADNLPQLLKVFETLCHTVAYAHQQGVIHRDLKPDNIMVGEFHEVQVMDWGLAKFLDPLDAIAPTPDGFSACEQSAGLSQDGLTPIPENPTQPTQVVPVSPDDPTLGYTIAGEVFGTLAYMPPEQARGEVNRLDRRGDVFALGAILCEILTGQPPYFGPAEQLKEMARAGKLFGAFVLLDRSGADRDLIRLAKHCLSAEPNDRPSDAVVLAVLVTECLEGVQDRNRKMEMTRLTAEARVAEAEARERLARRTRRLSRMLAVAGVMVAGLLASGLGWYANDRSALAADTANRRAVALQQIVAALDEAEQMDTDAVRLADRPFARDAAARRAVSACQRAQALLEMLPSPPADLRERFARLNAQAIETERGTRLAVLLIQWRTDLFDGRGTIDAAASARRCRRLFAQHGLYVLLHDPATIARDIAGHPAADTVRDAIADWLAVNPDRGERKHLAAVLRAAGYVPSDDWLGALDLNTTEALVGLADSESVRLIPASGIALAARRLMDANESAAAERLLRHGTRRYPTDYALNMELGVLLQSSPNGQEDAIRYLTAARVIRPADRVANLELGCALADAGLLDEALDTVRTVLGVGQNRAPSPATWAWAEMADFSKQAQRYAAAARYYHRARDLDQRYESSAAVCAALAGFGRGTDAANLSAAARAELRKRALDVLKCSPQAAEDPLLDPLREPAVLAELSDEEQAAWRSIWAMR